MKNLVPRSQSAGYDLVGIGSGIYGNEYHKGLVRLVGQILTLEKGCGMG